VVVLRREYEAHCSWVFCIESASGQDHKVITMMVIKPLPNAVLVSDDHEVVDGGL
jgi:hypothetical protein